MQRADWVLAISSKQQKLCKMGLLQTFKKSEEKIASVPGGRKLWLTLSSMTYGISLLLPCIQRSNEVFLGYSCLLWGPMTLLGAAPLGFVLWMSNFSILLSWYKVSSNRPTAPGWLIRLGVIFGIFLFLGHVTILRDEGTGVRIPLEALTGSYFWYTSLLGAYILRFK